jgi:hypothetical protein
LDERLIEPDDLWSLLLNASPAFADVWRDRTALGRPAGKRHPAMLMWGYGVHTSHLVVLGENDQARAIFELIEFLLLNGTEKVKDYVVCWFMEQVWIETKKAGVPPATLQQWMGPETLSHLQFLKQALVEAMSD